MASTEVDGGEATAGAEMAMAAAEMGWVVEAATARVESEAAAPGGIQAEGAVGRRRGRVARDATCRWPCYFGAEARRSGLKDE